jgi:hypothetical protein
MLQVVTYNFMHSPHLRKLVKFFIKIYTLLHLLALSIEARFYFSLLQALARI